MTDSVHEKRDPRLDEAFGLLQPPLRQPASAAGPLLAATLLACAGAVLVYLITLPVEKPQPQKPAAAAAAPARPSFELSASSLAASEETPPVSDAVILGNEESR